MKYLCFLLLSLSCLTIQSQSFDQYKYHATYIPSSYLKKIVIDGHIDDWAWVPAWYKLKNKDFMNCEHTNANDFDIECFVAWSDITNKIYIVAKVIDNVIISSQLSYEDAIRMNFYDGFTIIVNPNIESGQFWSGNGYKLLFHNIITLPITPFYDSHNSSLYYGTDWLKNKAYLNYSTSNLKNKNGTWTTYYEIELNLWEKLSFFSSKLSKPKILKSELPIGLTIAYNDVDKENFYNTIKIRTFSGIEFESHAEETSCFILDPPKKPLTLRDDLLLLSK